MSAKNILTRSLSNSPLGVKDAVQANYDLIMEIQRLLADNRLQFKQLLDAGQPSGRPTETIPVTTPSYQVYWEEVLPASEIIIILHHSSPIVEGMDRIVHKEWHQQPLRDKIKMDNT